MAETDPAPDIRRTSFKMQDIAKFVASRLPDQNSLGPHPDADLLTAFMEQRLIGREREGVLQHIAACRDCRNVAALSLPSEEEVQFARLPARSGSWLTLPVMRWGVVATGLLLVASFGVVKSKEHLAERVAKNSAMRQNPTPALVTRNDAPANGGRDASIVEGAAGRERASKSSGGGGSLMRPKAGVGTQDKNFFPSMSTAAPVSDLAGKFAPAPFRQEVGRNPSINALSRATANIPTAAVTAPPSMATGMRSSAAGLGDKAVASNGPADELVSSGAVPATNIGNAPADVVKAKPAEAAPMTANSGLNPGAGISFQKSAALMQKALPRWSIDSSGVLRRSFDRGSTWETVDVTAAAASSPAASPAAEEDKATESKSAASKPEKDSPVRFRAVAALGTEVWAGGTGATLYHSSDSGSHWSKVVPSANGSLLTGDVTGITFSDLKHGSVASSTGEVWNTADAGLSWQKQ